jgi:hypothetical protein
MNKTYAMFRFFPECRFPAMPALKHSTWIKVIITIIEMKRIAVKPLFIFKMYFYDFFLQYSLRLLFLCNVLSCEIAQNVPGLLFRIAQVLKKVFRKWCCTNLFFLSDLADSRRLISINSVQIYTSMWRFN